jgi:hypothetical protein
MLSRREEGKVRLLVRVDDKIAYSSGESDAEKRNRGLWRKAVDYFFP